MTAASRPTRWGQPIRCGPFAGERYQTTVRWLEANERECIRMMAFVVRDPAWRTLAPDPASVRSRLRADGQWTVHARTPVGTATLRWRFDVVPCERGLEATVAMTAEGDVVTNRAGLVVLLPAATFAGARFVARHGAGTPSRGRLPQAIAAHQPMLDLTGCRIVAGDGHALDLMFQGERFEMEDQRNWLDPTFKLYSRSLSRPFPYRIHDGAQVEQRVRIDLTGDSSRRPRPLQPRARRGRIPALGIATAPGRVPTDGAALAALRELNPAFVLHRTDATGRGVVRADRLAAALGAALRIETFGDGAALSRVLLRSNASTVAPHFTRGSTSKALRQHAAATAITGGTFSDFVGLNRGGVSQSAQRATFALCPTVHARDDRSLVETLDTLPRVFAQARSIAGGRPVDAGPCTLRRRLLPKNGRPADHPLSAQGVPYDVDSRQGEPIAAAWLAVVIAAAGAAGIESVCAYEAAGSRGLVGAHEAFPIPSQLSPGRRTPAHAALAALSWAQGTPVVLYALRAASGAAFCVGHDAAELWLVELSGIARSLPRTVARLGPVTRIGRDRRGATWIPAKLNQPLGAYGIARITILRSSQRSLALIARDWCMAR